MSRHAQRWATLPPAKFRALAKDLGVRIEQDGLDWFFRITTTAGEWHIYEERVMPVAGVYR